MKCNVGGIDRGIRFGLGTGALAFALTQPLSRKARMTTLAFGAMELLTATARYCPISQALGINTCPAPVRAKRTIRGIAKTVMKSQLVKRLKKM